MRRRLFEGFKTKYSFFEGSTHFNFNALKYKLDVSGNRVTITNPDNTNDAAPENFLLTNKELMIGKGFITDDMESLSSDYPSIKPNSVIRIVVKPRQNTVYFRPSGKIAFYLFGNRFGEETTRLYDEELASNPYTMSSECELIGINASRVIHSEYSYKIKGFAFELREVRDAVLDFDIEFYIDGKRLI